MRTGIFFQLWRGDRNVALQSKKHLQLQKQWYTCPFWALSESSDIAVGSHAVGLAFCSWPLPFHSPGSQAHQLCKLRHLSCTMLCRVRWVAANMQHSVKDSSPDVTIPNVSPDNLLCCQKRWKEKKLRTPSSSSEGTNADVKEGLCLSSQTHWVTAATWLDTLQFFLDLTLQMD